MKATLINTALDLLDENNDEDILIFTPTALGATTSGTWAVYFDGSDVGLSNSASEDINGLWVDSNNDIYLSTLGAFSVSGASGDGADVFICHPSATGSNTACTYGPGLYWDGSANGFAGEIVDVVALSPPSFGGTLTQDLNQIDDGSDAAGDDANPANPDDEEQTERLYLPVVVGQ